MPGLNDAFYPVGSFLLSLTSLGTTANRFTTGGIQAMQIQNMSTSNIVVLMGQSSTIVATAGSSAGFAPGAFVVGPSGYKTVSTPPDPYISACTTAVSISAVAVFMPGLGQT